MSVRVLLAVPDREYAAKAADYIRRAEPEWEVIAVTLEAALRRELKEGGRIDVLIVHPSMLDLTEETAGAAGLMRIVLVEKPGEGKGLTELLQFQPLSGLTEGIRGLLRGGFGGLGEGHGGDALVENASGVEGRAMVVGIFSASGGLGKTTLALNAVRQSGERGWRTFYLNLELLSGASLLFGQGEPDSLSRLLYAMQAHPEGWLTEFAAIRKHHPVLKADYMDAPDHPGERLAMTADKLEQLVEGIRSTGRYDLILVDADSGAGEWHRRLMQISDRLLWLVTDDIQSSAKARQLIEYWQADAEAGGWSKVTFVLSKQYGAMLNRWNLPGGAPGATLPYVPNWKAIDQPGSYFRALPYSGAVDSLLDRIGITGGLRGGLGRREREVRRDGARDVIGRGAG